MKVISYHFSSQNWPMAFFGQGLKFKVCSSKDLKGVSASPLATSWIPSQQSPCPLSDRPTALYCSLNTCILLQSLGCFQPGILFSQILAQHHLSIPSGYFFNVTSSQRRSALISDPSSTACLPIPLSCIKACTGHHLDMHSVRLSLFPISNPKLHENRGTSVFFLALFQDLQ